MSIQIMHRMLLNKLAREDFKIKGFTLIELLVSIIVVGLVTSGLLYLVNEVIRIDRREAALESVQRDMQRAMGYITDELQEAVYVYSTPTVITNQLTPSDLPTGTIDPVPVLAFWKPESISPTDHARLPADCSTLNSNEEANCEALKLRQSYYSLVVYFSLVNVDDNSNWPGLTRIVRYTLPQYTQTALNAGTAVETPGFTSPNNDFLSWAPAAGVDTAGNWSVLVDYVDSTGSVAGPLVAPATATDLDGGCEEFGEGYVRSPMGVSAPMTLEGSSYSFLSCVGQPGILGNGLNQDVVVLLRGNIRTAAQELANPTPISSTATSNSVLPTLKSQVLVRGATNKNP